MKIGVYHNLPSGGAKRTLYEQVCRLVRRHEVHVYALSTADEALFDLRRIVKVYRRYEFVPRNLLPSPLGRLNQFQRWRDIHRLDLLARLIAAEVDDRGYDAVLVHPCMWTQAPLMLRHVQTPSVYYCQEPRRVLYERVPRNGIEDWNYARVLDPIDPLIKLYRDRARKVDRDATRAADVVLVNSRFMQQIVGGIYGVSPIVSYHGVDSESFRPGASKLTPDYVLSVGSIQPFKGFDFIIESLGLLPAPSRPTLRLVANAEAATERAYLERLAMRLGVKLLIDVRLDEETLARRYREAALVVYAPYYEPFGLVPLEAAASGVAVVGVAEGGVKESILHEVTGLLAERNQEQFAGAVALLLQQPRLRETYGQQGREWVLREWTWDRAVDRVEEQLARAVRTKV